MTLPLTLYRGLADLSAPLVARRIAGRLRAQGVAGARPWERLGHATRPRPPGRLIWLHGASVGEGLAVLPLISELHRQETGLTCLVTTGTASSAAILADRLPKGALHQFAPLDSRAALRRFLDHWAPEACILSESEIWPGLILDCAARGIPVALVGARLSPGSMRNWQRFPATARRLFEVLSLVSAQGEGTADRLVALGTPRSVLRRGSDLKAAAPPLPPGEAEALAAALGDRPVWAAVSTHPGEEGPILDAHRMVCAAHPGALLLLVPRHPERAAEIAARADMPLLRRSNGERPGPDTAVWLCDTLGETGTWFRLASAAFLGGSLVPVGGHNPWEPARLGRAPLHGPHVASARAAYDALHAGGGAREVTGATLGPEVAALLADRSRAQAMGAAARAVVEAQAADLGSLAAELLALAARPR